MCFCKKIYLFSLSLSLSFIQVPFFFFFSSLLISSHSHDLATRYEKASHIRFFGQSLTLIYI